MSGSLRELDKAIKAYWYSRGFNKAPDTGGCYQMELDAFSVGWKVALLWIENELDKAGDGFEPDLGLRNLLKKELEGTE